MKKETRYFCNACERTECIIAKKKCMFKNKKFMESLTPEERTRFDQLTPNWEKIGVKKLKIKLNYEFIVPESWRLINADGDDSGKDNINDPNEIETHDGTRFSIGIGGWCMKMGKDENSWSGKLYDGDIMEYVTKGKTKIELNKQSISHSIA